MNEEYNTKNTHGDDVDTAEEDMQQADAPQADAAAEEADAPAVDHQKLMGILAYLGPLVLVSYLAAKDDPFVKFHIRQGLVLLAIEIVLWVIHGVLFMSIPLIWPLLQLLNIAAIVLSILGIVNVMKDKQEPLPLVGQFASYFRI